MSVRRVPQSKGVCALCCRVHMQAGLPETRVMMMMMMMMIADDGGEDVMMVMLKAGMS